MSIKEFFSVRAIPSEQTHEWLLKKHYAHRIPSISYSFGLYNDNNILQGICTFGYPPNYEYNDGKCVFNTYRVLTIELNRLVISEGLNKNALSFFVSQALDLLPKPCCIVSYSDPNYGHHGYIYQATNWIYTGTSTPKVEYEFENGKTFDIRRGIDKKGKVVKKRELLPTHRYLMFLGNKKQKNQMVEDLKWSIIPYPKGDNKRYDASYEPSKQGLLI
jgi:hypothetical protein